MYACCQTICDDDIKDFCDSASLSFLLSSICTT